MIATEIVESMGDAAFATRSEEGIIAWNDAAERLLGFQEHDVLGRHCYRILDGRDVFGNAFCAEDCSVLRMARRREAIARFEIQLRHKSGRRMQVGVSIAVVPNASQSQVDLVHVLDCRRLGQAQDRRRSVGSTFFEGQGRRSHDSSASRDEATGRLTPRELEILRLLADGLGTRAIAERLNISISTVRNHIQNILDRLGVHSRLEALSVARRHRLI